MYVCLCAAVSDRSIERAIDEGCRTLKELKALTGAMSQCCKCCSDCKRILQERTQIESIEETCP